MNPRQAHRIGTLALSLTMLCIGLALLIQVASGVGALLSPRLLLGALFVAAGAGRAFVELRRGKRA